MTRWQGTVQAPSGPVVVTSTSEEGLAALIKDRFGLGVSYTPTAAQFQIRAWMPCIREDGGIEVRKERISARTRIALLSAFDLKKHALARELWLRYGESLPSSVPQEYVALVKAWRDIEEGRNVSGQLREQPTLSEWMSRTLTERLERGEITANYAESVQDVIRAQIDRPFKPPNITRSLSLGSLPLKSVTQQMLQEFVDDLCKRNVGNRQENPSKLSPSYIKNIVSYIQASWAMLATDPLLARYQDQLAFTKYRLRMPKKRQQIRPNIAYSPVEIEQLIKACQNPTDLAIIGIGLTGARMPSEGRAVKWDDFFLDIDGETRFLRVERQIVHEGKVDVERSRKRTEGGEAVILHVSDRVWEMIQSVRSISENAGSTYVLTGGRRGKIDRAMSGGAIQNRFAAIKHRAKINRRGSTLYALRHTVTSMVMEIGGEEAARRIGGWTTSQVLRLHYDQARARILLPRAGAKLPWTQGDLPSFDPKGRRIEDLTVSSETGNVEL